MVAVTHLEDRQHAPQLRIQLDEAHQHQVVDDTRQVRGRGADFRAEDVAHFPGQHHADIARAQLAGQSAEKRIEPRRVDGQAAERPQAVDQHALAALRFDPLEQARTDLVQQALGGRLPAQLQAATLLHGCKIVTQRRGLDTQALRRFVEAEMQPRRLRAAGAEEGKAQ
ncbi:hypothetical protein D3C72_1698850 [compost metagenome]